MYYLHSKIRHYSLNTVGIKDVGTSLPPSHQPQGFFLANVDAYFLLLLKDSEVILEQHPFHFIIAMYLI